MSEISFIPTEISHLFFTFKSVWFESLQRMKELGI